MNRSADRSAMLASICEHYENFTVYPCEIRAENCPSLCYVAPDSLHSPVSKTAYGIPKAAWCFDVAQGGSLSAEAVIGDTAGKVFYLKLVCSLREWKTLNNDIAIYINGRLLYSCEREFVENVCQGWPALYYDVPAGMLADGVNTAVVATRNSSGAGLLLADVSFVALPVFEEYEQISIRRSVRAGDRFTVVCKSHEAPALVKVSAEAAYLGFEICDGRCYLFFTAEKTGCPDCCVRFGLHDTVLAMPDIVSAAADSCLVGTDSDDHRHDCSGEADRIIDIFAYSGMGDLIQFRPSNGRTQLEGSFAPKNVWQKRVDLLKRMNIHIGIADTRANLMPFMPDMAGDRYIGCHIHEPYLYFALHLTNPRHLREFKIDPDKVRASQSFGESEALYRGVLAATAAEHKHEKGLSSVGSPSLLCVYEAQAGFDRLTLEPVSNLNLLTAAGRGSASDGCIWGAHVPTDWYFGMPTDDCKSRKFRLALQYLYLAGASYLYAENSLFKTNAFARMDWEDGYCRENRQILRDFADYVTRNPRIGDRIVRKAVIYGRHEHFYWQHDDRMAELKPKDWDSKVWGKWTDDSYRRCWRAMDAWFPVAPAQHTCAAPQNKDLFSGTPFGDADIIPWESDYSRYPLLVLLGWNTMCPEMMRKLYDYVRNGGTLLLSLCHLNTTDMNDLPTKLIESSLVPDLLGAVVTEKRRQVSAVHFADGTVYSGEKALEAAEVRADTAVPLDRDGIFFQNNCGKGKVVYAAFTEYFSAEWAIDSMKRFMVRLTEEQDAPVIDNPAIAFWEYRLPAGETLIRLLNMNCAETCGTEDYRLTYRGFTASGRVPVGEIQDILIQNDRNGGI